jgi:phage gp29-like protein
VDLGPLTFDPSAPQVPQAPTPNRAAVKRTYREYPVSNVLSNKWDVDQVQAIVSQHHLGQFSMSSMLIAAMLQDDRIASALQTLILGILRLPFAFQPAKDTAKGAKAVQFIAELWSKSLPDPTLFEWIRWAIMAGIGLAEVVWDTSEDDWRPIGLKVWDIQHVYWLETTRKYIVITADGAIEVTPGDGKWLLLSFSGLRGHRSGAVVNLWKWWLLRDFAGRDWARHSEVLGQGVIRAKIPTEADEPDKDKFVSDLRSMGADGIIELATIGAGSDKSGFDVDLLEAEFDHGAAFEKLMLRCEANIAICLLGQNATTDNSSGPYVARGVFSKVTLDRIDGIVGPLETCLRDQLLRCVCEFNFDDADLAPLPCWDAEPPPDKKEFADTLLSVGQFLLNATNGGYSISDEAIEAFGQRIGVKLVKSVLPAIQVATLAAEAKEKAALTAKAPDTEPPAPAESGEREAA